MSERSIQERYAPNNACFGCGPANPKGLRLRSFEDGDGLVCRWTPEKHHEAFDDIVNGGILGTLLDCHSNWTAAWHLMRQSGADEPPCTVTARFSVTLRRPTPSDRELVVRSRVVSSEADRAEIEATIEAEIDGETKLCATCTGLFVAVQPGHPAYRRW